MVVYCLNLLVFFGAGHEITLIHHTWGIMTAFPFFPFLNATSIALLHPSELSTGASTNISFSNETSWYDHYIALSKVALAPYLKQCCEA